MRSGSAWPRFEDDRIVGIEEKPRAPKSHYAVTGIYMYDQPCSRKSAALAPSGRGELEITDVNNAYIQEGTMTLRPSGRLVDRRRDIRIPAPGNAPGSPEPRRDASELRRELKGRSFRSVPIGESCGPSCDSAWIRVLDGSARHCRPREGGYKDA